MWVRFLLSQHNPESSNGRTGGLEPFNVGPIPTSGAMKITSKWKLVDFSYMIESVNAYEDSERENSSQLHVQRAFMVRRTGIPVQDGSLPYYCDPALVDDPEDKKGKGWQYYHKRDLAKKRVQSSKKT